MAVRRLGARPANSCGTDDATQQRYRQSLTANGFEVGKVELDYADELDFDHLLGGVYSALPVDRLPSPEERPQIAAKLREVLDPYRPYVEQVPVRALLGTKVRGVSNQPAAAGRTALFASCGSSVRRRTAELHDRASCPCKTIGQPTCSADVLTSHRESAA